MDILVAGERAVLEGMLDRQREQISRLLDGIDESESRLRLVPSLTTPLGLVKHATFAEKVWFHARVAGKSRAEIGIPNSVDESFELDPADSIENIRQEFIDACARSRSVAAVHGLDELFPWYQSEVSLRFIYAHMIAELARHAGHGDILIEQAQAARPPTGNRPT